MVWLKCVDNISYTVSINKNMVDDDKLHKRICLWWGGRIKIMWLLYTNW